MDAELGPDRSARTLLIRQLCQYLFERSPQPAVVFEGVAHVVIYVNPAFARFVGREQTDLVDRPFAEAVAESAGNGCLALLDRVFLTGVHECLAEQEHRHAGPTYWSYSAWAIHGDNQRSAGVMMQVTDVTETATFRHRATAVNEALLLSSIGQHELIETIERGERERRALEAQMFQVQKLESLGVLAGGIAHDLNNMLTPVLGFTELAKDALPKDSPVVPFLDQVLANAMRAADLVQQILAYAGKAQFVLQAIDLSDLVRKMSGLLGSTVSVNTKLTYELPSDLPSIEADQTQIRLVVMNLVINASEALEQRHGVVAVRTGLVPVDQAERPYVFLEVTDSGCGMTADVVARIFDPFFTTKFAGRGLGLAVVHGIVQGHGGAIQVRSEPGCGSTFRLVFPSTTKTIGPPIGLLPSSAWSGTGTVLVIDDEPGVRNVAAHILEQAGLTVLVAEDGQEGVEVFRTPKQMIDAVVLDLTMPRMGRIETAGVLRCLRPDLPIVLMSGYTVEEVTLRFVDLGISGFVQKPFISADLLAAVRHALGQ